MTSSFKCTRGLFALTCVNRNLAPASTGLVQIDLPVETPEFDTYFVYPEELKDTKRVTVFRDFIVAKAKEWSF